MSGRRFRPSLVLGAPIGASSIWSSGAASVRASVRPPNESARLAPLARLPAATRHWPLGARPTPFKMAAASPLRLVVAAAYASVAVAVVGGRQLAAIQLNQSARASPSRSVWRATDEILMEEERWHKSRPSGLGRLGAPLRGGGGGSGGGGSRHSICWLAGGLLLPGGGGGCLCEQLGAKFKLKKSLRASS